MQVLDWAEFAENGLDAPGFSMPGGSAMTIGVFDGVHLGHRLLLERVLQSALFPVAVTFKRSPKFVLRPETDEGDILGEDQKLRILEQMGIGLTVMIDFSEKFSKLSGKEFIDLLKDRGNLRYLVIGSNFRCGYRHDTDAPSIKAMTRAGGITTDVVEPILAGGERISSSRIRAAIAAGSLVEAAALLGRRVEIDLSGLSVTPGPGGVYFHPASRQQITPPQGRYPVLLFEKNSPVGMETEVSMVPEGLFVPAPFNAVRIEFA
ncbi:putative riboflavin biosynthesis protein RibF [Treponema primitia ZAS-2]|uniref:FAD synthase n=1 Tax=Treponema primitia (strain ATCC BAA-887 / DSM 12427 / ZAS-2) TaxID=545694 RepID=F5YM28_TREPZ|nr:FAD synthetase family protein [Treponema primitia]AEF83526.1 putative riboflavin biosynthesis protein RibF [Treponema primitia ZAS-2]